MVNISKYAVPDIDRILFASKNGRVVDIGCYGWRLAKACNGRHLLTGVDTERPSEMPGGVEFALSNQDGIELPDDFADIVVLSHVLEHVHNPVDFFREVVRITAQGGEIWIESPSEYSAMQTGSNHPENHQFNSFWDDPTHIRPWTPMSLYRLALSCRCTPEAISRSDAEGIPSVRMLCRKPMNYSGAPDVSYVSLRNVSSGLENAWRHVHDEPLVLVGPLYAPANS